ncbi:hypothetical protein BH23GEM11_BH23GEM11_06990 [soil metagenome]
MALALVGPGHVGQALLRQVAAAGPGLRLAGRADFRVVALAASRRMRLSREFADPVAAVARLRGGVKGSGDATEAGETTELDALAFHLHEVAAGSGAVPILVDCTASDELANRYEDWLASGIHVVTPNKHAGAGPLTRYRAIGKAARAGGARWRYEATVGAGLPVVGTLQDLLATGDELLAVEGVLSGTLAYLLSEREAGRPFSVSVPRARELGFTEPDPREDLSGMDVARKMVILARESGATAEVSQVQLEGLVPPALAGGGVTAFMSRLGEMDAALEELFAPLQRPDHVIRYVGRYTPGESLHVGPVALPGRHPFAALGSTGSAVALTTRRYASSPLTIQGPGAGPEVTAAAVFADLLRVAESA